MGYKRMDAGIDKRDNGPLRPLQDCGHTFLREKSKVRAERNGSGGWLLRNYSKGDTGIIYDINLQTKQILVRWLPPNKNMYKHWTNAKNVKWIGAVPEFPP